MTGNARRLTLVALTLALMPTACSLQSDDGDGGPADTTSVTPTRSFAAPVGDPPQQGRGTPTPVRWDPCSEISDPVISAIEFAPETRERSDAVNYDYAFIGCKFERREDVRGQTLGTAGMYLQSANISLQQIRDREDEEEFTANGRAGIMFRDTIADGCVVAFPGPDGIVQIMVGSYSALTEWDACDHIGAIAETIEPHVPQ